MVTKLHPVTLHFPDSAREAAFRKDYFRRSASWSRAAVAIGTLQYALFGLLDRAMVPESAQVITSIRILVSAVLLGFLAVMLTRRFNWRTMQPMLAVVLLITSLSVVVMAYIGQSANDYYDYYAGLMLALFFAHALVRLRFLWATAVGGIIVASYLVVTALLIPTPLALQINNAFFLLSANLTGMVASYALEYYARRVYVNTEDLREQQARLEEDGARKSRELEAARRLQLATLPSAIPDHPYADWAAAMRPAAEVGGDYYDWDVAADGTVTLAIGDATGHGVEAGAVVTATQTVFGCFRDEDDLGTLLRRANGPLQRVGAGRLFMALAIARLRRNVLELAGAGMPAALLVRARDSSIETIALKGLPLGSSIPYPYTTSRIVLEPGDTVVFMTDGLPELFDGDRQMFGYERAADLAATVTGDTAATSVRRLHSAAANWRGPRPPNDDVTFLVLRLRPDAVFPDATLEAEATASAAGEV